MRTVIGKLKRLYQPMRIQAHELSLRTIVRKLGEGQSKPKNRQDCQSGGQQPMPPPCFPLVFSGKANGI
jgi:hypothetical protein